MKYLYIMCGLIVAVLFGACYQDKDQLFTNAKVIIDAGDTLTINKMEASITLTNINTNEQVIATTLSSNVFEISLLQGAYKVYAQGTIVATNQQGLQQLRRFRVTNDGITLSEGRNGVTKLQMFFVP